MRKALYSLLIFVSIFLFVDKVSAATDNTNVVYFDTNHTTYTTTYNSMKSKLQEILDYLQNNNPYNHNWVIWFGKDSSGNFIFVNLLPSSFSSSPTASSYEYCYINLSKYSTVYYDAGGCSTSSTGIKKYTFRSSSSLSTFKSDVGTTYSSISGKSSGSSIIQHSYVNAFSFSSNQYNYFSNNTYFILPYASSVKIFNYNRSTSSTFYKVKIGDETLSFSSSSYLSPSDNYTGIEEPNLFDEKIDDINYSKMIFNFDVSKLKERNNIFDYLINFETLGFINENGSLSSESIKFSKPYIEYVDENGILKKQDIDFGFDDNRVMNSVWYVAKQEEISGNVSSLRLIVPMYDTVSVRYLIQLTSFIPFTISYELDETLFSYYETLDLTGKYGVMFMPKLVENNSYISTLFYTRSIDSILVYDSYDYKQTPIAIYDNDISSFTYSFDYEEVNHNLFFIVNNSGSKAIVDYDTRYYTYKIVDSKYLVSTITNPNTNENHYIDFSNTSNISSNFSSISDVFEFISEQFDEQSDSYVLFQNTINSFFNTMPSEFYVLILTLFAIILLGVTLGLGGWR